MQCDNLVVLGDVSPAIKPPDAAIDVNHKAQPSTIRDEEWGGGTIRGTMKEFLPLELRLVNEIGQVASQDSRSCKKSPRSMQQHRQAQLMAES